MLNAGSLANALPTAFASVDAIMVQWFLCEAMDAGVWAVCLWGG